MLSILTDIILRIIRTRKKGQHRKVEYRTEKAKGRDGKVSVGRQGEGMDREHVAGKREAEGSRSCHKDRLDLPRPMRPSPW